MTFIASVFRVCSFGDISKLLTSRVETVNLHPEFRRVARILVRDHNHVHSILDPDLFLESRRRFQCDGLMKSIGTATVFVEINFFVLSRHHQVEIVVGHVQGCRFMRNCDGFILLEKGGAGVVLVNVNIGLIFNSKSLVVISDSTILGLS